LTKKLTQNIIKFSIKNRKIEIIGTVINKSENTESKEINVNRGKNFKLNIQTIYLIIIPIILILIVLALRLRKARFLDFEEKYIFDKLNLTFLAKYVGTARMANFL